ncbi:MAG: AmmeMemoRadiSam system protein A [Candidatus Bruticola sp.]
MSVVFWGLCPHPPLLIPGISDSSKDKVKSTESAFKQWAFKLKEQKPERIIIISPHAPAASASVPVFALPYLKGNMQRFSRQPQVTMEVGCDLNFIDRLSALCVEEQFPLLTVTEDMVIKYHIESSLDHASFIPLYFLRQAGLSDDVPVVIFGYGPNYTELYLQLGRILAQALKQDRKNTAIIASGDLSHRLLESGPYGFSPYGLEFDEKINKILRGCTANDLLSFTNEEVHEAAQCGLHSIAVLLGCLNECAVPVEVNHLSYEAPYGVGYSVVYYLPKGSEPGSADSVEGHNSKAEQQSQVGKNNSSNNTDKQAKKVASPLSFMHSELDKEGGSVVFSEVSKSGAVAEKEVDIRLQLAKASVEHYVLYKEHLSFDQEKYPELQKPAAVFVTLKKNDQLRGCIGSLVPIENSQGEEIVRSAILACSRDPRFPEVTTEELPELQYQVYVLSEPVKIKGPQELDPKRYGVIVRKEGRSGVLLPNLEGVDSIEMQLRIACQKGGILPEEKPELYRFTAVTYSE